MADVNGRIELNWLLDFYGPLLTPHRQEVVRLYCEEDLTQQEIAEQLSITRQGVFDALAKARRQLAEYEARLGLVKRHRALTRAAEECLGALSGVRPADGDAAALDRAREILENIVSGN